MKKFNASERQLIDELLGFIAGCLFLIAFGSQMIHGVIWAAMRFGGVTTGVVLLALVLVLGMLLSRPVGEFDESR